MSQTTRTAPLPDEGAPSTTPEQEGWVTRVLGVEVRRGPVTIGAHRTAPQQTWQSAKPSDPKAEKIAQPRDLKLAEIDAALKTLETAAAAIGAPIGRVAVDPEIEKAKIGREALAKATDRGEIAKQLAAAPALLEGIETARLAAVKDKADCEAHAAKVLEVNAALGKLDEAAKAIPAPLLRTAIDPTIQGLERKRDTLAGAATRDAIDTQVKAAPALLNEIEQARLAAVKDKADAEAHATKLKEVDDALQVLNDTADLITGQLARDPVDPEIKRVTDARNDLAGATTRDEISQQVAAQPALLQEIETVRLAAEQAEQDWQALQQRITDVEDLLDDTDSSIGWLSAGTERKGLENEAAAVRKSLTDLASAATLADYENDLAAAEQEALTVNNKANTASAPSYADAIVKQLGQWLPVFEKIAPANPIKASFDALTVRKNNAGSAGNPTAELDAVGNEASDDEKKAKKAYAADQAVVISLGVARSGIGGVADPTAKSNYQQWIDECDADRVKAYAAGSIDDLISELANQKDIADKLRIAVAGGAKMTQRIQASLKEADTAIKLLPLGASPRTELETDYTDLRKRLTDVSKIAKFWDKQAEYNAIDQEALALVELARKADFDVKAATVDGKKKIDELIKTFGDRTDDPVQQAVIRAAMQACYGVGIKAPEGMSVTTLPSLYQMMSLMPKTAFDGLKKIKYETDPLIDTSYYGNKKVVLNSLDEGTGENHTLVNQKNPSKKERVNYLNFTALHEFGHHVDDEQSVMQYNGSKTGFGQWEEEDFDDVVDAVYTAAFAALTSFKPPVPQPPPTTTTTGSTTGGGTTGGSTPEKPKTTPPPPPSPSEEDLRLLVRTLLEKGTVAKPAGPTVKPLGTLFLAWDQIEGKEGWKKCLAIRDSESDPWNKPTEISGGRAYHEGYEGQWYSYSLSERTSGGISNYQYRSPVEWFAEQYAFYRLKPSATKPTAIASYLSM